MSRPQLLKNLRSTSKVVLSVATICYQLNLPCNFANAVEGAPPRIEFFKAIDTAPVSTIVYNEEDHEVLNSKLKSLSKKWNTMITLVNKSIEKGAKQDALASISNYMGQLKSDLRLISKVACGGDIFVRNRVGLSGEMEAEFNYNSGQFQLKPIAARAEKIIDSINDLYFNYISTQPKEKSAAFIMETNILFAVWANEIQTNSF